MRRLCSSHFLYSSQMPIPHHDLRLHMRGNMHSRAIDCRFKNTVPFPLPFVSIGMASYGDPTRKKLCCIISTLYNPPPRAENELQKGNWSWVADWECSFPQKLILTNIRFEKQVRITLNLCTRSDDLLLGILSQQQRGNRHKIMRTPISLHLPKS